MRARSLLAWAVPPLLFYLEWIGLTVLYFLSPRLVKQSVWMACSTALPVLILAFCLWNLQRRTRKLANGNEERGLWMKVWVFSSVLMGPGISLLLMLWCGSK
ncbi:MAG TPA: hypothetical protein VIH99_07610 [Bdellovibrionota bacterium]|jgi:positive regulator of sigma E activity